MSQIDIQRTLQAAFAAYQGGQTSAAIAACRQILAQNPQQPDGLHILALALAKAGQVVDAATAFEQAAKVHPLSHEVLNNHANMLRRIDRAADAAHLLETALTSKNDFVEGWVSLGLAKSDLGNVKEAEAAYRRALSLNPSHLNALTNLGGLLNRDKRPAEAKPFLDRAISLNPRSAVARNNRASALTELHELGEALEDYKAAAQLAPQNADVMANLARAFQRGGDTASAMQAYNRSIVLDPANLDTHDDYNRLLWETGREDLFLQSIDIALPTLPAEKKSAFSLKKAQLAHLTGKVASALASAEEAVSRDPGNANAASELATLLDLSGEERRAQEMHRNAVSLDPEADSVRHAYAEFLLGRSEFRDAAELLHRQPRRDHLQKHISLQALALRGMGDHRYAVWYDYEALTAKLFIDLPKGWASIGNFLADVEEELQPLFFTERAPADQTLFNGAQSPGHLWHYTTPALRALKVVLKQTAIRFIQGLSDDPSHPFLSRKPTPDQLERDLDYSAAWAVRLTSGGGHVDHIHPAGWISASHYVKVPETIHERQNDRAGWLRLGASGVRGLEMPAEKYVFPEPGSIIIFPSYLWHGVEPFTSEDVRITTPFDLTV